MNNNYCITFLHVCERSRGLGRLVGAMAMVALILPLGGCWGSAGGEGTIDIASARSVSGSNPNTTKAAFARDKGGIGKAQKARRK
jgi:hypothetical protein